MILVTYKTAKLVKESIGSFSTDHFYVDGKEAELIMDGDFYRVEEDMENEEGRDYYLLHRGEEEHHEILPRPSLNLVQEVLREEYNLWVLVQVDIQGALTYTRFDIYDDKKGFSHKYWLLQTSYEDSLEQGIMEALKMIKNEGD